MYFICLIRIWILMLFEIVFIAKDKKQPFFNFSSSSLVLLNILTTDTTKRNNSDNNKLSTTKKQISVCDKTNLILMQLKRSHLVYYVVVPLRPFTNEKKQQKIRGQNVWKWIEKWMCFLCSPYGLVEIVYLSRRAHIIFRIFKLFTCNTFSTFPTYFLHLFSIIFVFNFYIVLENVYFRSNSNSLMLFTIKLALLKINGQKLFAQSHISKPIQRKN